MIEHADLKKWVDQAETATVEPRRDSERDRDYYDGKQWSAADANVLKNRNQPVITDNRIAPMVNHLLGLEIQRRTDPKALPRTPQHEDQAEAATDALRFVEERTNFDRTSSAVFGDMIIEGFGGVEVTVEEREGQYEVSISRYPWDRLGYDPASSEADFSDARYVYALTWMDHDEAIATYPGKESAFAVEDYSDAGNTYDDKPKDTAWTDSSRKRVKLCLMYYLATGEGGMQWHFSLFSGGGEIEGGVSPYLDEYGEPENPLIMQSAYVDRDNNRYGAVRNMISMSDEHNQRRSKILHLLSSRQFLADEGAVKDERETKGKLKKPDEIITVNHGKRFELLQNVGQVSGQFALLQDTTTSLDRIGPSALSQGKDDGTPSGRAILASQQGGLVELAVLFDRHSHFKRRVYRQIWNRIRQFWNEERWVRVTDDENNVKFVGLNRQMTIGDAFIEDAEKRGVPREQAMQEIQNDPRAQLMFMQNAVADVDVDIIIEEAPDTVTMKHEQFGEIVELARAGIMFPPDVLIELAPNIRNKQRILDMMKGQADPEQAAAQAEQQQREMELAMRDAMAGIAIKEAQAQKMLADAQRVRAEVPKIQSETAENAADVGQIKANTIKTMVETAAVRANATMQS